MSNILLRECCEEDKFYIVHFNAEPSALLCEDHFADKALLIGAKKIYNLKTKQEVPLSHDL